MLGAIADDFTGATDLATMLRRSGHRVAVVIEDADPGAAAFDDIDAVVVALKTRTSPAAEAVDSSLLALERLRSWGADRFYFKYCSTFDSTDDGNIGPVLDALSGSLGARRTVVVPSLPANGRTVAEGRLFVGGELLENSPMRHHPLTPMTRSRVADLLRPQTSHGVTEVHLAAVRSGVEGLAAALAGLDDPLVVVDATTDDDLATIGAATRTDVLVSGGSGLALGIPGPGLADTGWHAPEPGGRLVLCGSVSEATRRQIDAATDISPVRSIDLDRAALDAETEITAIVSWVRAQDPAVAPIVCAARTSDDIRTSVDGVDTAPLVESVLTAVARALVTSGDVTAVIVAGGESSGAVVRGLGVETLRIGPELAPGVCWATTDIADGTVALALKSGNFGADDLFLSAWEKLA
ncbi:3-oxo-tetronate kinase [Microbacterium hatanonis]|uniref:3-oxo-tetronate kinase n=1 Tax=Microbacterium hatanonis TaxID=404366 RepID=A0A5C8I3W2_9MICO|nr:3-oxo-tetronate kinase [Microbacterium hatanonis]TXK12901.1 four-carbon acid sugar kinase family protein [Microbacterium hatanonis]